MIVDEFTRARWNRTFRGASREELAAGRFVRFWTYVAMLESRLEYDEMITAIDRVFEAAARRDLLTLPCHWSQTF